jgi:hypothetical protein
LKPLKIIKYLRENDKMIHDIEISKPLSHLRKVQIFKTVKELFILLRFLLMPSLIGDI